MLGLPRAQSAVAVDERSPGLRARPLDRDVAHAITDDQRVAPVAVPVVLVLVERVLLRVREGAREPKHARAVADAQHEVRPQEDGAGEVAPWRREHDLVALLVGNCSVDC